jgi:hypothetical protein
MPSVSHDANLRFQMARRALGHYVVRGTSLRRGRGTSRGSAQSHMCVRDVAPRASKGPLLSNTRSRTTLIEHTSRLYDTFVTVRGLVLGRKGVSLRDMFRYNVEIEIARDQNMLARVHPRLKLDPSPCRMRHGAVLNRPRAARRRERPSGRLETIPGSQDISMTRLLR